MSRLGLFLFLFATALPAFCLDGKAMPALRPGRKKQPVLRAPGVYPVYELEGRWLMIERARVAAAGGIEPGSPVLVIGSEAAAVSTVSRAANAPSAACRKRRPARVPAYLLNRPKERVGTPVIALRLGRASAVVPGRARFRRLSNEVDDAVYASLGEALKQRAAADIRSGDFLMAPDDPAGTGFSDDPRPEKIFLKIDFGASVPMASGRTGLVLVEGVQVSKSYRRCLRLAFASRLAGGCAEMPHILMAETNLLEFVVYDPNGSGRDPFLLAYTVKEPLWGHERWGFRLTRKGPVPFLKDALDPKCRERF